MTECQEGDRVRLLETQYFGPMLCDGSFETAAAGSLVTVTFTYDGEYIDVIADDFTGEHYEMILFPCEYEWAKRPTPLQRRCNESCDHT
jgi:hypothetical protein